MTGTPESETTAKDLLWNAYGLLKVEAESSSGSSAYLTRVRWLRDQVADLAMQAENLDDLQSRHLLPDDEPKVKSLWEILTDAIDEYKDGHSRRGVTRSLRIKLGAAEAQISELKERERQKTADDSVKDDGKVSSPS